MVAPTVIADGARAGETLHAFCDSLPAATAYVTPAAVESADRRVKRGGGASAEAHVGHGGPLPRLAVTQSMPLITPEVEPEPLQLRTRTATRLTRLATP